MTDYTLTAEEMAEIERQVDVEIRTSWDGEAVERARAAQRVIERLNEIHDNREEQSGTYATDPAPEELEDAISDLEDTVVTFISKWKGVL